jgi:hypothetical protein
MATTATAISEKSKRRNITLSLSEETVRKAKILAARRDTSVSGLLTQQIEELATKDDEYQQAKAEALAMLRSGFTFGKIEHMTREEMHDRKAAREAAADCAE